MSATCNCFNAQCCNRRRARGLKPFCVPSIEMPAPRVIPENEFGTYSEAAEYARIHGAGFVW